MPPRFSRENKHPLLFSTKPLEYQMRTSPCEANCPAGNGIQKNHFLLQNGQFREAMEDLLATNPFPGTTGRVCHHPCEEHCHRNSFDQPLSIKALERAASDFGGQAKRPVKKAPSGKSVAIIGSGPCGLTGAYYLAWLGHKVTLFEALPFLGGIPRAAIPDYTLPKEVVDREVNRILELGIEARMNSRIGEDIPFEKIQGQYDACFIAAGAWRSKSLPIPGSELALPGKEFLIRANSKRGKLRGKVVVMGSGNVAMDCASMALRLGASEVHIVCRAPRDKMKAAPELVDQAQQEGVMIHPSRAFLHILCREGQLTGLECCRTSSYEIDGEGKVQTETIPGTEHVFDADTVIMAIGQSPDLGFLKETEGLRLTSKGTLEVNPFTLGTGLPGLFGAGDVVTGPSSVAEAIGSGRRAAFSIDAYLRGGRLDGIKRVYVDLEGRIIVEEGLQEKDKTLSQSVVRLDELMNLEYFEKKDRIRESSIPSQEFPRTFEEINRGIGKEEASEEAGRCFHCGHCFGCGICAEICPGDIIGMADQQPQLAYPDECYHCGSCLIDCPASAISFHIPLPLTLPTYPARFFLKKEVP